MRRSAFAAVLVGGMLLGAAAALALMGYWIDQASTTISVTFVSDPPGATLAAVDSSAVLGATPFTREYAAPTQWQSCVSYDGFTARWPDGTRFSAGRIELCPDGGTKQEIRITAPRRTKSRRAAAPQGPDEASRSNAGGNAPSGDSDIAPRVDSPLSISPQPRPPMDVSRPPLTGPGGPVGAATPPPSAAATPSRHLGKRVPVLVVERRSSETGYYFVVPGYVSTTSRSRANCDGRASGTVSGTDLGSFYSGTYSGTSQVNCYGSSSSTMTVSPPREVSYSVTGATLSLRLPDGRIAVVNCNSKFNWTDWSAGTPRRSCRTPSVDRFETEFNGEKAKLIWRIGIRAEKEQSETYKLIEILEPRS